MNWKFVAAIAATSVLVSENAVAPCKLKELERSGPKRWFNMCFKTYWSQALLLVSNYQKSLLKELVSLRLAYKLSFCILELLPSLILDVSTKYPSRKGSKGLLILPTEVSSFKLQYINPTRFVSTGYFSQEQFCTTIFLDIINLDIMLAAEKCVMVFYYLQESCSTVKRYIDGPLGHYVINVTSAAKLCSKVLCKKNGRCIRKNSESSAYLHLSPTNFKIQARNSERGLKFQVTGEPSLDSIEAMRQRFMCQCYQGWTGIFCELPAQRLMEPWVHIVFSRSRKQKSYVFLLAITQLILLCTRH